MADRPILFSAPMVRALLDGRKTQTRRILKPQPGSDGIYPDIASAKKALRIVRGDRLWVREAWMPRALGLSISRIMVPRYRADEDRPEWRGLWKPGIHMFRWASRLTLTVTDVRVQRLQDISKDDAVAEGLIKLPATGRWVVQRGDQYLGAASFDPRSTYAQLWDEINGTGAWDTNPWVAAYSFTVERLDANPNPTGPTP